MLWAWERPEHLSYILPDVTGVAYLAGTVTLGGAHAAARWRPRLQPLYIPLGTPLIGVVRVESSGNFLPPASEIAREILQCVQQRPVRILQIDFDARRSEQGYYRRLLEAIRRLDPQRVIEITALVSWCEDDRWMRGLPVADAVPMFFRMGKDPHATSETMREPLCQASIGISTDEFYVHVARKRRVFVFAQWPWTESSYQTVLRASKKWFAN